MTLPEGFELAEHRPALEPAAKHAGWTIDRDAEIIVVRDVWTENEDHAARLVATKASLQIEAVAVDFQTMDGLMTPPDISAAEQLGRHLGITLPLSSRSTRRSPAHCRRRGRR